MSGGDGKYFQTTKKGEIKELQDDLNSVDKTKIKEAVKKVIAAMTVGKDVSMLFSDVIKSMATDNIELKKLVYLYIINYARSQPEKAILVVNMFQKDATNNTNPLVRALAIRTMGCIRVDRVTEYLCDPLGIALKDQDPYVRKTAAICVAKLYDTQPELVEERGFIENLRAMLSDSNPMVVANAVAALAEISESSGKDYFLIDGATLSKLLTALNECTEWGRVFILDALAKFEAGSNQAKDICDRVVPQLQHANVAVVMAAVRVIVKFMSKLKKEQIDKYIKKLAPPLVTLVSSTPPEIQYVALRNIDLIVQKYPKILQNEIRVFFVKFNDAVYVKMEKLEILIKLANKRNVDQVLLELKEYATEIDVEFVRKAVRAIGRVAVKLEVAAERCVRVLSELVANKVSYVVQESIIVIKDIFRRYPQRYEKIIVTLCENLEVLDEPEAKASMIWIIGEYAERIVDADERLSFFIQNFGQENAAVQLQLLTATVKLFLKKPDKSKALVQKVLDLATEKSDNPDLRDRGYVYWRLLSTDPATAKSVVLATRPEISPETFSLPKDYLTELLDNVSTLSSVYHRTPTEFAKGTCKVVFKAQADADGEEPEDVNASDNGESSDKPSADDEGPDEQKGNGQDNANEKDTKENEEVDNDDDNDDNSDDSAKSEKAKEKEKAKAKDKKKKTQTPKTEPPIEIPSEKKKKDEIIDILDLFGPTTTTASSSSATTNTTAANKSSSALTKNTTDTISNFLDDLAFPSNTNQMFPSTTTQYSESFALESVVRPDGQGISIDAGFKRSNNQPVMVVRVTNNGQLSIQRMDIKFNVNYLGVEPTQTLPLNGLVTSGSTQVAELPLGLPGEPQQRTPLSTKVQVAVRVSFANSAEKPIFKFDTTVAPHIFFETLAIDKNDYLEKWKNIQQSDAQSVQLKPAKTPDIEAIKTLLGRYNCIFISPRQIPDKGISLYFATKLRNQLMLIETAIANSGAIRIQVRAENKYLAFVTANAVQNIIA